MKLFQGYAYTKVKVEHDEFMEFLEKHTEMCDAFGFKLWGVNLNKDSLSYKHALPFNTKAIILVI